LADGPENSKVESAADAPFPVAVRELCVGRGRHMRTYLVSAVLLVMLIGCGREFHDRSTALEALAATNATLSIVESTLGVRFTVRKRGDPYWQGTAPASASSWRRLVAQKAQGAAAVGHTSTINMQTYIFLDEKNRLIDFEIGAQ
jgi:hypothetical protein